jgi:hypothetical protein
MGPSKVLALALATAVTASTSYGAPPAISNTTDQISVTTVFTTTAVTVPVSEQSPSPTISDPSCQAASVSSIMTTTLSSTATVVTTPEVPFSGSIVSSWVNLPSFEASAGNTTVTSTNIVTPTTAPSSVLSTTVVTATANTTHVHSLTPTTTANASTTPSHGPQSGGGNVKVGVAIGLAALIVGVLGA